MGNTVIGIMGAMPEEIEGIAALLQHKTETTSGGRTYYSGLINGTPVVLVFSRWGKVAAATTVTHLILQYHITHLYFTGVAGGIGHHIKVGDIVIASQLVQHDMDARPLMPQYQIPLLGKTYFDTDITLTNRATEAAGLFVDSHELHHHISTATLHKFGITQPTVHTGIIASGDKFVSDNSYRNDLLKNLPCVLCVEMEGAAVAQVCYEYNIPCCIIRTISDSADEHAHFSFTDFIQQIAGIYSLCIIKNLLA
ncbi:MAG TPA: 5'-methylthioadenosine/adenosylhomocysteine nucleosidase [Chitinophagales bacterium]|nr:5'-methylthioadenosine/adenosylhomocysteine nucleosidase [Chitinophagales bacterium]